MLARNGRAPVGDLRYYVDTRLERFSTAIARAQLGAALAMYGDKARASEAFASAMALLERPRPTRRPGVNTVAFRNDFGSSLRDRAATLALVAETGVTIGRVARLTDLVTAALKARSTTSTQENAWLLLAARALLAKAEGVRLMVGDRAQEGTVIEGLDAAALARSPLVVRNEGAEPIKVAVTVTGAAMTPEPARAHGFTLKRRFFTLDGRELALAGSSNGGGDATTDGSPDSDEGAPKAASAASAAPKVAQNTRLVVVLEATPGEAKAGQLLLVDRLPAGFEIENPRIVDSASIKSLSWLKTTVHPSHSEFRDDRFVASFDLNARGNKQPDTLTIAYMVRAVTPGRYVHPPATIEDMYRPERFARTASGTLEIAPVAR